MVFCNVLGDIMVYMEKECHNPYFNRWFSAILSPYKRMMYGEKVTILILIDGFLQ